MKDTSNAEELLKILACDYVKASSEKEKEDIMEKMHSIKNSLNLSHEEFMLYIYKAKYECPLGDPSCKLTVMKDDEGIKATIVTEN